MQSKLQQQRHETLLATNGVLLYARSKEDDPFELVPLLALARESRRIGSRDFFGGGPTRYVPW